MLALVYRGPGQKQLDERAKPASEAVRHAESDFILVEGFDADHKQVSASGESR